MKNLTKVAVAVAALTASAAGFAGGTDNYAQPVAPQDAFYVGLHGGFNIVKGGPTELSGAKIPGGDPLNAVGDYLSTGMGLGLNVGYKFAFAADQAARVEFEYTYLGNKYKGDAKTVGYKRLSQNLFMLNGIYDYSPMQQLTLSVGAGLGLAHLSSSGEISVPIEFTTATVKLKSENRFAMQLIAGASYNIMPELSLGVSYKFTPVLGTKFNQEIMVAGLPGAGTTSNKSKVLYNNQIEFALNYFIPA